MKRVLIAMLAALLAVSAGAALASGHHHGGHGYRAAAGRCYRTEGGYCHKDGACAHDGDACHFYADEDGDNVCDRCVTTGQAKTANSAATTTWTKTATAFATAVPRRKWRALPATTAATADTNESAPRGALFAFQKGEAPGSAFPGASKRGEG